jgi:glutaredoxin-related protein
MNIKVYGSNVCPATLRFISLLTENGIMPQFINVTGSINLLKEFITFRDTSPLYDGVRGSGAVGFPLIELEDGTRTRDVNQVLADLGIQAKIEYR